MVTTETQNNDGAAADETGKTGEARKEAVQENGNSFCLFDVVLGERGWGMPKETKTFYPT